MIAGRPIASIPIAGLDIVTSSDVSVALSGQSVSYSQGVLSPSITVALSGQSVSFAQGNVTPATGQDVALTGQSAAYSLGSFTVTFSGLASGQSATTSQGNVTANINSGASGQAVSNSQGALATNLTASPIGQSEALSQGSLAAQIIKQIAGQQITQEQGTIDTGDTQEVLLTGQSATYQQGTVTPVTEQTGDTHDGDSWKRYRAKLERIVNMKDALEVVQESPEEAIEAIQEADVKPNVKAKIARLDYQKVINDLKLQEFIAKQLLIVVELQRIAQEDDDLLTFMMMD